MFAAGVTKGFLDWWPFFCVLILSYAFRILQLMKLTEIWPYVKRAKYDELKAKMQKAGQQMTDQIAQLKQGKIPAAIKPKVEEVFRDPEGRVYYRFKEVTEMPWRWAAITKVWIEWGNMNLTPDLLNTFLDQITENFNAGTLTKAATLIENLKNRQNLLPSEEITWRLAALMYLREDERPEDAPAEALLQEKITYWKSVPEIRDFFLSMCLKGLFDFGTKSPEAILASFKKDQETLKALLPDTQPHT